MALQLQFRHDCQNLGCSNSACNLCKLSQRRRCPTNFAAKYLAPCDVVEAKCGAQIYVVVTDEATGQLVQQGLEELAILISIIDARKFEGEVQGGASPDEALDRCELLENKQGQPLLAHGRSGSYTDSKRVLVPMIHGQALLPDLKITDSSEALLTGRAPPFRLAVRAVHRSGEPFEGVAFALSEAFVVATARVKGAAKLEIPHIDDHVSKIDCVGLQTQKKLEDIKAAAVAAGVPDLNLPVNSVVKVGQFRDLVEAAERNKALRETLKQVLRLTKGWDVARDHVRKAVETDVQLRVYHPDGRTEVGLVFKCGSFNVIDINRPIGLMRRKQNPHQANQELVDVIWLPLDAASFPDAVKRMLPQASTDWRKENHVGWALLPLTTNHMPPYSEGGKPTSQTSSFTFTIRSAPSAAPGTSTGGGAAAAANAPAGSQRNAPSPRTNNATASTGTTPAPTPMLQPMLGGGPGGMNGFGGAQAGAGGLSPGGALPLGLNLPGLGLPPLPNPLQSAAAQQQQQQQLGGGFMSDPQLNALRLQQQRGPGAGLPGYLQQAGVPANLLFGGGGGGQQQPGRALGLQQQQQPPFGLPGLPDLPPALAGLDTGTLQSLMQMPTLDLFNSAGPNPLQEAAAAAAAAMRGGQPPALQQPAGMAQAQRPAAQQQQQQQLGSAAGSGMPPDLANLLKEDSLSPFEDPNFQQLMSMVAANAPTGAGGPGGAGASAGAGGVARGPAPRSGGREKAAKRKADTSLETWMEMNKGLDLDVCLPNNNLNQAGPLESLFTSMLPGGGDLGGSSGPPPPPVGFFPAMPSSGGGEPGGAGGRKEGPKSPRAEAAAAGAGGGDGQAGPHLLPTVKSEAMSQQPTPRMAAQQQEQPQPMSSAGGGGGGGGGGGAEPMDVQQPSESTARGGGGSSAAAGGSAAEQQQAAAGGPAQPQQQAAGAAAAPPALAPVPTPLVTSVTLEQMQQQFARAMRQEITFDELEQFLKQYNLLPSGQPAGGAAGAMAAVAAGAFGGMTGAGVVSAVPPGAAAAAAVAGAAGKDLSGGLEDMQMIEQALPSGSHFQPGR